MTTVRRPAIAAAVAVAFAAVGCGRAPSRPAVRTPVELEVRMFQASEADRPTELATIPLDLQMKASYLVAIRLAIGRGEVDCVVGNEALEVARRRVSRLGDDLVVIPVVGVGGTTLKLVQPARTGPLELEVKEASIYGGGGSAVETAREIAEAFEIEAGRTGDPAVENLVANPDFASDDEVRGTPADWYAYVDTSYDVSTHTLRVAGAAPERRPFLATGPIPVEAGRRYRATWRMAVVRGAVVVRAVDYDELATVFAEPPAELGAPGEASVDFTPAAGVRAVRLRFEGPVPAADTAFDVSVVQVEALPAR